MDDELIQMPLTLLHEPRILLRPIRKETVEYLELRESVRTRGFINSVSSRPSTRKPHSFEIIDGETRRNVALDLRLETIPCIVKYGLSDLDVLAEQIHANAVRIESRPIELARHLRRISASSPDMRLPELAIIAGKSSRWVKETLELLLMSKDILLKIDRGDIPIQSARMLNKIRRGIRHKYVDAAMVMPAKEFCALAASIVKQFKESVNQGELIERYAVDFAPQPYMRGVGEVRDELFHPKVGATLIVKDGCETLVDAWNAALRWVLHLDQESVETQRKNAEALAQLQDTKAMEDDDESPLAKD